MPLFIAITSRSGPAPDFARRLWIEGSNVLDQPLTKFAGGVSKSLSREPFAA
jgi:hypothetical protein